MTQKTAVIDNRYAFILGAPAVLVVTSILVGGLENTFELMFLSIVCTLGAGLFVWMSLCWLAGMSILAIIRSLTGRGEANDPGDGILRARVPEEFALTNYLRQAAGQGISREQVAARLRLQGWSDAKVERAFQFFDKGQTNWT